MARLAPFLEQQIRPGRSVCTLRQSNTQQQRAAVTVLSPCVQPGSPRVCGFGIVLLILGYRVYLFPSEPPIRDADPIGSRRMVPSHFWFASSNSIPNHMPISQARSLGIWHVLGLRFRYSAEWPMPHEWAASWKKVSTQLHRSTVVAWQYHNVDPRILHPPAPPPQGPQSEALAQVTRSLG